MCLTTQQAAERQASRDSMVGELYETLRLAQWLLKLLADGVRIWPNEQEIIDRVNDVLLRAKEQQ